jgi:CTP:molybdopterin cytidylyltransferase MocA
MPLTLVVLAAGLSSRYGGSMKQTDAVGPRGETLLDYGVYDAIRAGFTRIVFVVRPEIERHFAERVRQLPDRVEGRCVYQTLDQLPPGFRVPAGRVKPWGTGHAVMAAAGVDSPFVVINADDFYGASAYARLAGHLRAHAAASPPCFALVGYRLRDTLSAHGGVSRAICRLDDERRVMDVIEVFDLVDAGGRVNGRTPDGEAVSFAGDELVSMSIWGFTPAVFPMLRARFAAFLRDRGADPKAEFLLPVAVSAAIAAGEAELVALAAGETWCGMTSRQDREEVRTRVAALVARGVYPSPLFPERRS